MLRALAKGAALFGFGRVPGGPGLYRTLTRDWMGTQATHVDKLARVWPGYVRVWRSLCGIELEGKELWVHEAGWTPFAGLAGFALTGRPVAVTNCEARLHDRYLVRAVNGVLECRWPEGTIPEERRERVGTLRWADGSRAALELLGCTVHEAVEPGRVPLPDSSVDLVHSGGALEHLRPEALDAFLADCRRVLRPGGVASHVFDHRDHLHHADHRWPFLAHQVCPEPLYRLLCGHELLFHNRLPPAEVTRRFEASGFEAIAVRRMVLPSGYVPDDEVVRASPGLPGWLARRASHLSELDLRTAAAHYLFRRR